MRRSVRLPRSWLLVGAGLAGGLLGSAPSPAEESLQDHFSHHWYYTEVVVFERPQVQDHDSDEALTRPPAPLARSLRRFRGPLIPSWADRLDAATRACLTFPALDLSRLPESLRRAQLQADAVTGLPEEPAGDEPVAAEPVPGIAPPSIEPRLAPDPLLDFLRQVADFETGLEAQSYRWLDPDTFTLKNEAQRLSRRGGYQVLLHGRWLQPVPAREAPEPLWIQAGPRYGDTFALEGTFDVTLGRYLHFGANLYYKEPLLGRSPADSAIRPPAALAAPPEDASGTPTLQDLVPAGYMQLRQSRRMRSEELHYLDHPKLGVLVRIEPVAVPQSLSDAYAALEEGEQ